VNCDQRPFSLLVYRRKEHHKCRRQRDTQNNSNVKSPEQVRILPDLINNGAMAV
jgi:polyferredoxin